MSRKNFYQIIYKKTWFKVAYILVIIAIIVLVIFVDKHQKNRQKEIKTSIAQAQSQLLELGASPPTPEQPVEKYVYNWQGEVTKVEDNKIIFSSPYENSLTKGDDYMDITVYLKPETEFLRLDLTKPLTRNEIIYSRASQIEKSKIKIGKTIIAQSEKDLNLNLEMEATAVYLIET